MANPTVLTGASYAIKINGVDLHEYGVLGYEVPNLGMAPLDVRASMYPERHEAYRFGATFQPRPFVIQGMMLANNAAGLRSQLDLLKPNTVGLKGNNFEEIAPIRVEFSDQTDRYYPCAYAGEFRVVPIGNRPSVEYHASFSLTLLQLTPFALATDYTLVTLGSGVGPQFEVVDVGTGPCPWVLDLEGAATAPDMAIADCEFYADFDYDLVATVIDGTTKTGASGAAQDADQFYPGAFDGTGLYLQATTFTTSWTTVISNPKEVTVFLWVRPQFGYDVATDTWLLEYWVDANNGWRLYYDATNDVWKFEVERATAVTTSGGSGTAQTFTSGTYMCLAASFNGDGVKVYKDGTLLDTDATTGAITGTSGTLYLGNQAADKRPLCQYEQMAILPFQLSDEQVKRISQNPQAFEPFCVKKSKSDNIAANDRIVLDFGKGTATAVANADLAHTNDLAQWDANGWPMLRPPMMCYYIPSGESIGRVQIAYRKRYL